MKKAGKDSRIEAYELEEDELKAIDEWFREIAVMYDCKLTRVEANELIYDSGASGRFGLSMHGYINFLMEISF